MGFAGASFERVARLAELGQLAAGILHEVNNAVSILPASVAALSEGIKTLAGAARARPGDAARRSPGVRPLLRSIEGNLDDLARSAELATSLLVGFRSLACCGCEDFRPTDVHTCIEDALRLSGHQMRHRIRVEREFGRVPPLTASPRLLTRVFLNLFVNASQFTEGEGVLRIRTGCEGREAFIAVSDDGQGIAPDAVGRLFRPFFTTRPAGEGLGLGLSISKRIIERHGGRISATSEAGRGTTFDIRLPVAAPWGGESGREGGRT